MAGLRKMAKLESPATKKSLMHLMKLKLGLPSTFHAITAHASADIYCVPVKCAMDVHIRSGLHGLVAVKAVMPAIGFDLGNELLARVTRVAIWPLKNQKIVTLYLAVKHYCGLLGVFGKIVQQSVELVIKSGRELATMRKLIKNVLEKGTKYVPAKGNLVRMKKKAAQEAKYGQIVPTNVH